MPNNSIQLFVYQLFLNHTEHIERLLTTIDDSNCIKQLALHQGARTSLERTGTVHRSQRDQSKRGEASGSKQKQIQKI